MSTFELLGRVYWGEWVFYSFVFFVISLFVYNKELQYTIDMNENYKTPWFETLLYSFIIPTKYLKCQVYQISKVRSFEFSLHGVANGLCTAEYDISNSRLYIRENDKHTSLMYYNVDDTGINIGGVPICLPPKVLIMALCLYDEEKKKAVVPKKSLLT